VEGGSPARELELAAIHRLGGDKETSEKVPGRSLKNTVAGQPKEISCGQVTVCSTVLGSHLEIKVNNCPLVSLWGQMGKFPVSHLQGRRSGPNMAVLTVNPTIIL
jgi:hypothetical protein